jgi:hypothetical protein
MRAGAFCAALALNVSLVAAAAAQTAATDAEAHIFSAFTSRADHRVLADEVKLGPALRRELGAAASGRQVYDELLERLSGRFFRVNAVRAADAAQYAVLVGGSAEPLVLLEAGELVVLMQYAPKDKQVAFVEQLSAPAPKVEPVQLPPEAPKPAPIVEVPLPATPPAPPPAVVEKRAPAPPPPPVVVEKPVAPKVAEKPKPPAPVAVQKPMLVKPRGECVIKPVMSEDDLWNCSAPSSTQPVAQPAPVSLEAPAPPATVQKSQPSAAQAPHPVSRPRAECVIKPVMTDDDLRACGAR